MHKNAVPDCMFTHCTIHHDSLPSKTLGPELMKMQKHVIKLINTVKSSALNTSLLRRFYEEIDADHYNLLKARWLSKNNVLKRIFALQIKLRKFFEEQYKIR